MRKAYSLLLYLALPFMLVYLGFRGLKDQGWTSRWRERFAFYREPTPTGGVVVHAASVGEINAASPLVAALLRDMPEVPVTLTTFTPTGSRRARELFGLKVRHLFVPIDLPGAARRLFRHVQPRLLIVMETEIWPNLFAAARQAGVPVIMSNARLSASSMSGYRKVRPLIAHALGGLAWVGAQTRKDRDRLVSLGAPSQRTTVSGNIKFDLPVSATLEQEATALRAEWGPDRPVLTAGSTRPGDETVLLSAFGQIRQQYPDTLMILAPRHPERFAEAAASVRNAGYSVSLRSEGNEGAADTDCLIVDTLGELMRYYACSDVAFVGGTFADIGGHNLLEPAALGKPVLFGPHTENVDAIARELESCGGGRRLHTESDLVESLAEWFEDETKRRAAGLAAKKRVESGRGAVEQNMDRVRDIIRRA